MRRKPDDFRFVKLDPNSSDWFMKVGNNNDDYIPLEDAVCLFFNDFSQSELNFIEGQKRIHPEKFF